MTNVTPADSNAAHALLSELRTRITTQPLPYQYGSETRALECLWEVFTQARAAMKQYPGCNVFAAAVTEMLNMDVRPVTAKWQRAYDEGHLNSHDGADEFRGDLAVVQEKLRAFAGKLQDMIYASLPNISREPDDQLTLPAISEAELDQIFSSVKFGIDRKSLISDAMVGAINDTEAQAVKERRAAHGITTPENTDAIGLALSGGGIRSATFSLGVVQVLADRGFLKEVDFLSTVSGGGYTGSFITTRLGVDNSDQRDIGNAHGPDPDAIRYLRRHAKYLPTLDLKQRMSMVTATLAGMLLNWTVPLLAIVILVLFGMQLDKTVPLETVWPIACGSFGVLTAIMLVTYGVCVRLSSRAALVSGTLLGISFAGTALSGIGWLVSKIPDSVFEGHTKAWKTSAVIGAVITVAPTVFKFFRVLQTPAARRVALKVLLALAGLVVPILGIAVFYLVWRLGMQPMRVEFPWWNPLHYLSGSALLAIAAIILAFVSFFILNINLTSPHRMYRNGLARTFVSNSEQDEVTKDLVAINPSKRGPYHLINATVNLPSSTDAALRDRKSDFFLFSKNWCGSPTVGYAPTATWQTNGANADLATAMAISGAAASSYMGLGSMPSLVSLMTFLNVRLGFWIRRPDRKNVFSSPGFYCLLREMTGFKMSETQTWINLSDGGHLENMAVYELLRRRCKFIICVDGEADPEFTFQGLMTLVRHAQLDFGVRIDSSLDQLRFDPKSTLSQTHFTLCRIHYPKIEGASEEATGLLLYLKLSVTGNESELIKRYRKINGDFPHESTIDQFFSEEQFEAYRQLGVHVAEGMFSRTLMNETEDSPHPPRNVPDWFRRLAGNLLT